MKLVWTARDILKSGLLKKEGVKRIIEIGCGNGEFLKYYAEIEREAEIWGLDISNFALKKAIYRTKELKNVKLAKVEGLLFLTWLTPENSIDKLFLLFPDPWESNKKRRLVKEDFLKFLLRALKKGGEFYFSTDSSDYYGEVLENLQRFRDFFDYRDWQPDYRTKYFRKWFGFRKNIFSLKVKKLKEPEPTIPEEKVFLSKKLQVKGKIKEDLQKLEGFTYREGEKFLKILKVYRSDSGAYLFETIFHKGRVSQKQYFLLRDGVLDIYPVQGEIYPESLFFTIKGQVQQKLLKGQLNF